MRTPILAGALALGVLFSAGPAAAAIEVGAEAPSFAAGDYINTEPVKISDLSGRLILLELFKTT